jgi:hypothetical protein
MKVTIWQYYKSFLDLKLLFAGVPFLPLLLHLCVPDSTTFAEYLYPPLGDVQRLAFAATFGFLLLTTFVVFTCCRLARKVHTSASALLMVGAAVCVCALIALYVPYVRRVPVPSINLEVPVSIGYQRTDFALQTYQHWSDWEMLHDRGPWEEQIQKLWTQQSIIVVRVLLWFFYTMTLACFLSIVSIAAYQHTAEEDQNESKRPAR